MQDLSGVSTEELMRMRASAQPAPVVPVQPAPVQRLPSPPRRVDPVEQERLRLAQEASDRAAEASARAAQSQGIANQRFEVDMADRERRLAVGPIADAREGEANNAAFFGRAERALSEYNRLETELGGARSIPGSVVAAIPGGETLLRTLPDFIGDSPARRNAEKAKLDFVNLILRSDSGAAVPEQEVARALATYFPAAGESDPAVLESFRERRQGALDGLRAKSGRLAQSSTPSVSIGAGRAAGVGPQEDDLGTGARLSPEQDQAFAQFIESNRGRLTPAMINDWYVQNGLGASDEDGTSYADAVNAGRNVSTAIDYSAIDAARRDELAAMQAKRDELPGGPPGTTTNIRDIITSGMTLGLADEAAGIGGAIVGALDGRGIAQGYRDERDLARLDLERSREGVGAAAIPLEIAGGVLSGRVPALVGPRAPLSATRLMREGSQAGALAGFGYGEGLESVPGALLGAAGGAALGYGFGRLANRGGGSNPPANPQAKRQEVAQAADDQGINLLPADVGGGTVRGLTAAAVQAPGSAERMANAVSQSRNSVGDALQRTADNVGNSTNTEVAGNAVRRAGQAVIDRSRAVGERLYQRAAQLAHGVRIRPAQTLQAIDAEITRLSQTRSTSAPLIAELQKFRDDLSAAPYIPVSVMRDLRTTARQLSSTEALRATDAKRVLGNVMRSLSDEIETGLNAAGRGDAARAFRNADTLWRERIEYIDQVLEPIIGNNRSAEQVFSALEDMAKDRGNTARLRQMLRALSPQERGDIEATIVSRLGRSRADDVAGADDVFSPATFLRRWETMTPQAKNAMFQGDLRRNLDQIVTVSSAMRAAARSTNTSNTAGAGAWLLMLGNTALNVGTMGVNAAAQNISGRMMTSPGFTRWLARAPRNGNLPQGYIRQLGVIAAREPNLARELGGLQRYLSQAAQQSPSRAAASGSEEQDSRQIPPQ